MYFSKRMQVECTIYTIICTHQDSNPKLQWRQTLIAQIVVMQLPNLCTHHIILFIQILMGKAYSKNTFLLRTNNPEGITCPLACNLALTLSIIYLYYIHLVTLFTVPQIQVISPDLATLFTVPQIQVILPDLGYPVYSTSDIGDIT